ncbi:uncharacterized protein MKK02DRAFT_39742 [Dioszegia hungarica]|uniref:HIT domain-containing protein n=1 Tax=Dioszegia hungarica TaxID=4972 RepID=A0AA38HF19_9TREE|nr:uncharacterized protein MKK02DRAFT_39742 [Dioszegia hungarica]KAI9639445.1 hypothetical protein MKK02DRAFT_39742 [Dioszegia hungarica]
MSLPSPASTPATSPMPLHPTFASALIPPSPDPSHAPRGTSGTSRPLLPSRLSSVSGPSSSLIPPAAAKRIPSRYSGCQLCELVREARKVFGYSTSGGDGLPGSAGPSGSRRGSADGGGERDRGPDSAGPSTASSSSSFPSHTRPQGYAQPVQQASGGSSSSNASPIGQTINGREILYHDPDITVYPAAGAERLRSEGKHLVIVVNTHAESVYEFGPSDVPLLSKIIETAQLLLDPEHTKGEIKVGFVGNVMKDPQSPHAHLHAHALLGPPDTSLPGSTFWRRNVVYGFANWWSVQDLRAEIREGSSNNRIKSGYENRTGAPIEKVPNAGSSSVSKFLSGCGCQAS